VPDPNRVTPLGDVVAIPLRGAYTGNRGRLHPETGEHDIVRFHAHDSWVTCSLQFHDRWNEQWLPHKLTWLYFYDEAVSFAAGHRPCAECRYRNYKAYQAAWGEATGDGPPSAKEMNRTLHRERLVRGTHRRRFHEALAPELPDGVFVVLDEKPFVLVGEEAIQWTREGYDRRIKRPSGEVTVITPPSTVAAIEAGYEVDICL
jgi:hypothetical protein